MSDAEDIYIVQIVHFGGRRCFRFYGMDEALKYFDWGENSPIDNILGDRADEIIDAVEYPDEDAYDRAVEAAYHQAYDELYADTKQLLQKAAGYDIAYAAVYYGKEAAIKEAKELLDGKPYGKKRRPRSGKISRKVGKLFQPFIDEDRDYLY